MEWACSHVGANGHRLFADNTRGMVAGDDGGLFHGFVGETARLIRSTLVRRKSQAGASCGLRLAVLERRSGFGACLRSARQLS